MMPNDSSPPDGADRVVLVTGGSGYLGGWATVALLRRGYRVRATVRTAARERDVRAAVAQEVHAEDRLAVVVADLLGDAGWDRAVDGAEFVLHVASPMPVGEFRGQDLVRPAREGTRRVLAAAARAGVRRVVLTSSLQAALPPADHGPNGAATDERVWTDLGAPGVAEYTRAKTLAEQDAWAWARGVGGGTTLSTVLPAFVQGPVLGPDYSGSLELVARLLRGAVPALPRVGFSIVDVRDLVDLHLRAMTAPEAAGERFIASADFLWTADVARVLRARLGARAAKVPTRRLPDLVVRLAALVSADARQLAPTLGERRLFSAAKAERVLGWRPRPAADAVVDCAESLLRHGLI